MNSNYPRPKGQCFGDSIVVDQDRVFLKVENEWFFYFKKRAQVGIGGMGSVLLGYSCNSNMQVAIKRIHPEFFNRNSIRERIRLESKLTFAHPNLVETLGCCEVPGEKGPIFIVSKYIHGQTIDIYVNTSFTNAESKITHIIPLLKQLASAIDFIHSMGIIHLDIKPSNIMIERGSTVKLLDLGIAEIANNGNKTHGYGVHGTLGYAAPEQHLDKDNPELKVDIHTDIYGLASTTYSLLTGHTPDKSTPEDYHTIRPSMQEVFDKALSKVKEKRHDSAKEFVGDLETAIEKDYREKNDKKWNILLGILCISAISIILILVVLFVFRN